MAAIWTRVRSDLRREWRSIVALGLLVGLSGGVVLTAVAGARRTDSAFDRLRVSTAAADVRVQYSSEAPVDDEVLASLRAHPNVDLATPIFITVAMSEATRFDLGIFTSSEPELLRDVDRPRIIEGRTPELDRADEVIVNPFTAESLSAGVGDRVEVSTWSPEQLDSFDFSAPPAGPRIELTIVGIGRLPDDVANVDFIGIFGTPAFHERYGDEAGGFGPSIEVLTRDGSDPMRTVEDALADISFDELILESGNELAARTEDGTRVLVTGLLVFALVAGLGAVVACSQAIQRRLAVPAVDHPVLRAIGFTGGQRRLASTLTLVPIAVGGGLLAGAVSIPASTLLPIGRARLSEPDPGVDIDPLVLAIGVPTLILVTLLITVISSRWVDSRRHDPVVAQTSARRPMRLLRVAHASSSPAAQLGVTMALEPGRGRTAVPVRSALFGAVAGVTGVIAALTFSASLDALVDTPARYGWNWAFVPDVLDEDLPTLLAVPGVQDVGTIEQREVIVEGEQLVGMAMVRASGRPSFTILRGRMPATTDEILLGPKRAEHLGAALGDTVEVQNGAGEGTRSLVVVGEALFPSLDGTAFNDGVGLTSDVLDAVAVTDGEDNEQRIVSFAEGISREEGERRLIDALPDSMSIYAYPVPPGDVGNLSEVRSVPRALAVFLVLLALAAVWHALSTSVRRRRRDLGVVRTIGFLRRDVLAAVGVQSATMVAVGVGLGLPLGIIVGRLTWSVVASGLGVAISPAVPGAALAALVVSAFGASLVLAVLPARAAARLRAVDALRAE